MVRTRGNLSRRGSNDAPESSRQGGARKRPTASARKGVSMRLMLLRMILLRMRFPTFLRRTSRGLITMVKDFLVVHMIHLY